MKSIEKEKTVMVRVFPKTRRKLNVLSADKDISIAHLMDGIVEDIFDKYQKDILRESVSSS